MKKLAALFFIFACATPIESPSLNIDYDLYSWWWEEVIICLNAERWGAFNRLEWYSSDRTRWEPEHRMFVSAIDERNESAIKQLMLADLFQISNPPFACAR